MDSTKSEVRSQNIPEDEPHYRDPREAAGSREIAHQTACQAELKVKAFGTEGVQSIRRRVTRSCVHFGLHPVRAYHNPELVKHLGEAVEVRYSPDDDSRCWVIAGPRIIEALLVHVATDTPRASQRDIITQRQWTELSRLLAEQARSGFSSDELATINGFINYVAPDVEPIQQEKA